MDNNNATLITVIITASVTLIVAIIGAVVTILSNAAARKNEHRLAVLKVLLEAAYKEYEFRTTQDLAEAKAANRIPNIKSFTEYIIFYSQMSGVFSKGKISEDDIISCLKDNKKLIDAYYANRDGLRPEYHKQ